MADQRTMSGLTGTLTGQTFDLPVMLTGQNYSFIYFKYAQLLIPWFQKCELQWTATIVILQWNVKYKTDIAVAPAFLSPSPLSEKSPDEYVSNVRARKIT